MELRICLLAVTALTLTIVIKQWKSDFLPLVRIAIALTFALLLVSSATPLISFVKLLLESTVAAQYTSVILKALGVAILTQCCCDICKECGENGIATGVEIAGKIEIMLLALPLINEILSLAKELMTIGA